MPTGGLKSGGAPGREPALSVQQMAELCELVVKGPDPAIDRVVRWRCTDLQAVVAQRFSVHVRCAYDRQVAHYPVELSRLGAWTTIQNQGDREPERHLSIWRKAITVPNP